jgi:hypothetical protein
MFGFAVADVSGCAELPVAFASWFAQKPKDAVDENHHGIDVAQGTCSDAAVTHR